MFAADSFAEARVVVLDPNRTYQSMMRAMLRHLGFRRVEIFGDPDEALARVMDTPIDLVFVDQILPGLSGIDWVKSVRRGIRIANPDMAVVMMSSCVVRSTLEPAVGAGIDSLLLRPFAPETVARHARRALGARHAYVSGPGGYWGPDQLRTRLRMSFAKGAAARRLATLTPAAERPRLPRGLPGLDVGITPRKKPNDGSDTAFID